MGSMYAAGIAETDLALDEQITWHLRGNFFPPVPTSMVTPCVEAIDAYNTGDVERLIRLPEGVGYKGLTAAPAIAIIEAHRLETWLDDVERLYE